MAWPEPSEPVRTEIAYDVSGNVEYLGKAQAGARTSQPRWRISRFTYDASNNLLSTETSFGNNDDQYIWDDRATLNYV